MIMLFKDPSKQREFSRLHPKLKEIVLWMGHEAWDKSRDVLVVTDMYRDKYGSVHKYWRGIDIALLEYGDSEQLRIEVNKKFPYGMRGDGTLGETIVDLRHGSAPHFHVQVKP